MEKIENAKITNVSISMADHGCFTFFITLDGGGWGVNVGGYCIGHGYLGSDHFSAENGSGLIAMMEIMNVVGVERWEDLVGKYVRVKTEGPGSRVTVIGNILKEEWFDIDSFFGNFNKEEK